MSSMTRHLTDEQKRRVTQLHLFARLDSQRRHLLRANLGNEFRDATCDLDSILVKLALPEEAGQHRAPQLQFGGDVPRWSAFMRPRSEVEVEQIESSHLWPPFELYAASDESRVTQLLASWLVRLVEFRLQEFAILSLVIPISARQH